MQEKSDTGGCTCRAIRYRLRRPPLLVHCCHCTWCQRETGASFALNAMIETANLETTAGEPELVLTPSSSGRGQKIARCGTCRVAVWSHYASLDLKLAFVRVGTLDNPAAHPPGVHIFTASKQPWVSLPVDTPRYEAFYGAADRARMFGPEGTARWEALRQ